MDPYHMDETGRCVGCGAEIPPGKSSGGLCPACLLKLGVGRPDSEAPRDDDLPTASALPGAGRGGGRMIPAGQHFGPYRIDRLLGKGGMGEVYEAEDESGGRLALKVLTHGLDDASDRARFLREGRLAASISHPHTVYVYGTEEIEGIPVITMELAPGGTLKEHVKEVGPLPTAEAVDTILQIVAGLDAAAATGVLHRDVKPSNCFLDSEGRVKVGDFGLSISTLARAERDLTLTGTFLGTPEFASPEQLRADDVDMRSDIYSVGVTLYYLLTGRPPFEDTNILKLASMIAQQPPRLLTELRPDVPPGLAAVVLRCMGKTREERFPTYAALVKELEPFSSAAPQPGSLGLRVAAGAVDWFVAGLILTPVTIYFQWVSLGPPTGATAFVHQLAYLLVTAMYFAVLESRVGASLGKALCGLRVIGPEGLRPGFARALERALVFGLALRFSELMTPEGVATAFPGVNGQITVGVGLNWDLSASRTIGETDLWYLGVLLLLFVTARRRNGFRAIHERLTGTRVVTSSSGEARSVVQHTGAVITPQPTVSRIGPYQVLERLDRNFMLGYDGRLRRKVWIHTLPIGAKPLPPRRRDLGRPGRLHWLTGKRTAEECWDAYEAVRGRALVAGVSTPQPWSQVRHWLRDLTDELRASLQDQSLPTLALDRVWVTSDQRVKLLDWPAPGVEESVPPASVARTDHAAAQQFLMSVAASALEGRVVQDQSRLPGPSLVMPLPARRFLQQLGQKTFQSLEQLATALDALVAAPTFVTRRKRWVHLGICAVLPAIVWTLMIPGSLIAVRWASQNRSPAELALSVDQLYQLQRQIAPGLGLQRERLDRVGFADVDVADIVRALEIHVAETVPDDKHRSIIVGTALHELRLAGNRRARAGCPSVSLAPRAGSRSSSCRTVSGIRTDTIRGESRRDRGHLPGSDCLHASPDRLPHSGTWSRLRRPVARRPVPAPAGRRSRSEFGSGGDKGACLHASSNQLEPRLSCRPRFLGGDRWWSSGR